MRQVFAIYDNVSEIWQDPIVATNVGEARRAFILSCSDPRVPENYLKDIELYCLGDFDENTGELASCKPKRIMNGDDPIVKVYREGSKHNSDIGGNDHEISNEEISEF